MVPILKVKTGVLRFIEQEICANIEGWQKFIIATAGGLFVSRMETALTKLPLGLSQNGQVDVEAIYKEASKHMDAPVAVSIPAVGSLTFTKENLDTLYRMIIG